ncbi:MAG: hypothetical protein JWM40_1387 [Frankiales bacterium]|nr:hypothetical protein [Frankiales bacterium]
MTGRRSEEEAGGPTRTAGFVTVAVTGLMAVLLAVAGAVALLGGVAVARHRAAGAADLAALAAAGHAWEGSSVACQAAQRVTAAHGAHLDACRLTGMEVEVEASVRMGRWGTARALARAGPADPSL